MPVARPVREAIDAAVLRHPSAAAPEPSGEAGRPAVARIADDLAVPAPSPVHRLQAVISKRGNSKYNVLRVRLCIRNN